MVAELSSTVTADSGFPYAVVDVRDVSLAHVTSIETEKAGGERFFLCVQSRVSTASI